MVTQASAWKQDLPPGVHAFWSDLREIFKPLADPAMNELKLADEREHQMTLAFLYDDEDKLGIRVPLISHAMPHNFHGTLGNFELLNVTIDRAHSLAFVTIDPERSHEIAKKEGISLKEATIKAAEDMRFQGLCASVGVMFILLPGDMVVDLLEARKAKALPGQAPKAP